MFKDYVTSNILDSQVTNNSKCFQVPASWTDQYKNSFFVRTAIDWNHLADDIVEAPSLGTEQFGRKTDEIVKFSILDRKTEFAILDGIWTKNGQMTNQSLEKIVKIDSVVAEIGIYTVFQKKVHPFCFHYN